MTATRNIGGPVLALLVTAWGCTSAGTSCAFDPADLTDSSGWVFVRGVPALRQTGEADSGIAALGMIFAYWGLDDWPRERVERVCPIIDGRGTRARDLRSCAREAGLEAHLVHGTWEALLSELRNGRPVIVGLVKSYRSGRDPQYEVLIAAHPRDRLVVTFDPRCGWRQNSVHGFLTEWEATTELLLVFSPPVGATATWRARDAGGAWGSRS